MVEEALNRIREDLEKTGFRPKTNSREKQLEETIQSLLNLLYKTPLYMAPPVLEAESLLGKK